MNYTQDFVTSRDNISSGYTKVGQVGRLWYDSETNTIRLSDGQTPGGILVGTTSGPTYYLPPATANTLGGIKVGAGLNIDSETGILTTNIPHASTLNYGLVKIGSGLSTDEITGALHLNLPKATPATLGGVMVDNITIKIDGNGIISTVNNTPILPIASSNINGPLGGIIVGNGLSITSTGVLSSIPYILPVASTTVHGGIKVGSGLTVDNSGFLNLKPIIGFNGVNINSNNSSTLITVNPATTTEFGVVKIDNNTIIIDNEGVIKIADYFGTVKSFSFDNSNGFIGTITSHTSNPKLTVSTTVQGIIKGNNGSLTNALPNVDYQMPITVSNTGDYGPATFINNVLNIPNYQAKLTITNNNLGGPATLLNGVLNIPNYGTVSSIGIQSNDISITSTTTNPITNSGIFNLELKTIPISKGGTGSTVKENAFSNLSPTALKGDLIYHDGITNVRLPAGDVGKILQINDLGLPNWESFNKKSYIYVNKSGNLNGDGTIFNPYNSIGAALTSVFMTDSEDIKIIKIAPGIYYENNLNLIRNVFIVGDDKNNTIINCATFTLNSTFYTSVDIVSGFKNATINLPETSILDINFITSESDNGKLFFENINFNCRVKTTQYTKNNIISFLSCEFDDIEINGGWNNIFKDCLFNNDLVVKSNGVGYKSEAAYAYFYICKLNNNIIINLTDESVDNRLYVFLYGTHLNITTELQIYGNNGGVYATTESIPIREKFKNFNDAPFYRLNDSFGIQYIPADTDKWNIVPDNINQALDYLVDTVISSSALTSIDVSGGETGLRFIGGPITDEGTITLEGTLKVSNGGTGRTFFDPGYVQSNGTLLYSTSTIPGSDIIGDISGKASGVYGVLDYSQGGTNANTKQKAINNLAGPLINATVLRSDGSNVLLSKLNLSTDVVGVVAIENGGTGANNSTGAINNLLPNQSQFTDFVLSTDGSSAKWLNPKIISFPNQTNKKDKFLRTDGVNVYWEDIIPKPAGLNKQLQFNNNGTFSGTGKLFYEPIGELIIGSGNSDDFVIRGADAASSLMAGTSINIKAGNMYAAEEGAPVPPAGNVFITAGGGISEGVAGYISFKLGNISDEKFRITNTGAWTFTGDNTDTGLSGQFLKSTGEDSPPEWADLPEASTSIRGIIKIKAHDRGIGYSGLRFIQHPRAILPDLVLEAVIKDVDIDDDTIINNNGLIKVNIPVLTSRILPGLSGSNGKYLSTDGTSIFWTDVVIPIASTDSLGAVIADGTSISIDSDGYISINSEFLELSVQNSIFNYFADPANFTEYFLNEILPTLPNTGGSELGLIKIDNDTLVTDPDSGITRVNIPPKQDNEGKYLRTDGSIMYWGVLDPEQIPTASSTQIGVVKVDNTTIISNSGVISANIHALLPPKTPNSNTFLSSNGTNLIWTDSVYVLPIAGKAPNGSLGGVIVDNSTISIDTRGVISTTGIDLSSYSKPGQGHLIFNDQGFTELAEMMRYDGNKTLSLGTVDFQTQGNTGTFTIQTTRGGDLLLKGSDSASSITGYPAGSIYVTSGKGSISGEGSSVPGNIILTPGSGKTGAIYGKVDGGNLIFRGGVGEYQPDSRYASSKGGYISLSTAEFGIDTLEERLKIDNKGVWYINGVPGLNGQTLVSKGENNFPEWGILPVSGGGTGTNDPQQALDNLLPDQTNKELHVLTSDGSTHFWSPLDETGGVIPVASDIKLGLVKVDGVTILSNDGTIRVNVPGDVVGTVTSIDPGTTGFVFDDPPISEEGTLTMSGVLDIAHGGTGATSRQAALNNLLPDFDSSNSGSALTVNTNGALVWGYPTPTAAGTTGQLQFNDSGLSAGTSRIFYNSYGNTLTLGIANDTGSGLDASFNIVGANSTSGTLPSDLLIRSGAQYNENSFPSNVFVQGGYGLAPTVKGGNVYIDGGLSSYDIGGSVVFRTSDGQGEPLTDRLIINNKGAFGLNNLFGLQNQVLTSTGSNSPPQWKFMSVSAIELTGDTLPPNLIYSSLTTVGALENLHVSGNIGIGTEPSQAKLAIASTTDDTNLEIFAETSTVTLQSIDHVTESYKSFNVGSDTFAIYTGATALEERLSISKLGDWKINDSAGEEGDVLVSKGIGASPQWVSNAPKFQEITTSEGQTIINTSVKTKTNQEEYTYLQVFRNGILQRQGVERSYIVTGDTQITFNFPLAEGDDIVIYSFVL